MNREIKFRGIASCDVLGTEITHGDMIFGQVVFHEYTPYIVGPVLETDEEYISLERWCPIRPETLGEFTGLKDKNGVEIYEGDIVIFHDSYWSIHWNEGSAGFSLDQDGHPGFLLENHLGVYVVGNLYENAELLEANP